MTTPKEKIGTKYKMETETDSETRNEKIGKGCRQQRVSSSSKLLLIQNEIKGKINIQISNVKKKKEKKHKHRIYKHRKKRLAKVVANTVAFHLQSCYKYKIRCNVHIVKYQCETDNYTNIEWKQKQYSETQKEKIGKGCREQRGSSSSKLL